MPEAPGIDEFRNVAIQPPTERDFARSSERILRQTSSINHETGLLVPGGLPDQVFSQKNQGEAVDRLHRRRREKMQQMSGMNYAAASIINMMPFPLNVSGVLHSRLQGADGHQVPECPVGSPYVQKIIREIQWSIKDEGAGMDNVDNLDPIPWSPMTLAEDYALEFLDKMKLGGVVIYQGDHKPDTPGLLKALNDARLARNRWLLRKVQEAEADWNDASGKGKKNITDIHRKSAEVLIYEKILKHQPAWLLVSTASMDAQPDACIGCGAVPDVGAAICKACGVGVFDPMRAYKACLIEYGHISFDLFTEEQWAEATEIKKARDRARQVGSGKKAQ